MLFHLDIGVVMNKYYMTFGTQYAHEAHPLGIHPDGYVTIEAADYGQAREKAFELTGGKFAFIYEDEPEARYFPLGSLMYVVAEAPTPTHDQFVDLNAAYVQYLKEQFNGNS